METTIIQLNNRRNVVIVLLRILSTSRMRSNKLTFSTRLPHPSPLINHRPSFFTIGDLSPGLDPGLTFGYKLGAGTPGGGTSFGGTPDGAGPAVGGTPGPPPSSRFPALLFTLLARLCTMEALEDLILMTVSGLLSSNLTPTVSLPNQKVDATTMNPNTQNTYHIAIQLVSNPTIYTLIMDRIPPQAENVMIKPNATLLM
eukprot:sb/3470723/